MSNVRRAYIYLACIASLEAVCWAVISLLRYLLAPGIYAPLEATAVQIAVIIVGLPIYLVHWLWAQRLARRDAEERGAVLRQLYLFGAMAIFLAPFLSNAVDLLESLLRLAFGLSQTTSAAQQLVALAVFALLFAYHWRVAAADREEVAENAGAATIRRLYAYGFSAAGLAMTTLGVIALCRWLMFSVGGDETVFLQVPAREVGRLVVGLPLWLIFWSWAQRLFAGPGEAEHASTLRKVYQYLAVFLGALATVTTLAIVLADGLGRAFGVSGSGSGDIREALSIILGAGLVWAYHAYTLGRDATAAGEPATTAWVGRLYRYLVAAIGLGALLAGLGGAASLLIRSFTGADYVKGLAEEAARFTALILVGLPVWILPWRQVQLAATTPGPEGAAERRSVIRKGYLYLYLFAATMTMLGSGVFVVSQLVRLALGVGRTSNSLAGDLAQALAFSLIAVAIWLYHGSILRADGRRAKEGQAQRLASLRVAVLDTGDGLLGRALVDELKRELPGLNLEPLGLTPEAAGALGTPAGADLPGIVAGCDLIVGPWIIAVPSGAGDVVTEELAQAIVASPAAKVLIPTEVEGWQWAAAKPLKTSGVVRQVVRTVKDIVAGKDSAQVRPGSPSRTLPSGQPS